MIYIVGLGPGSEKHLTQETIELLSSGERELYLRTEIHPTVEFLKKNSISYHSFDDLYEKAENFSDIYAEIAERLANTSEAKEVIYAVPGNPLVAEKSVFLLIEKLETKKRNYKVIPALSSLESIYAALRIDPLDGLLIIDAASLRSTRLNRSIATLLVQVYDQRIASDTKLELLEKYPDTYPLTVIRGAGIPGEEKIVEIPLYQLDRIEWIDHLTSVLIKPDQFPLSDKEVEVSGNSEIDRLVNIVSYLRSPNGCPWDKVQTHESIRKYVVEEAYEVVEAIEKGDPELLQEELGDLLLQVVLHSQISSESNVFSFEDVAEAVSDKLWRRHPHVFGDQGELKDDYEVKNMWDKLKNKEKEGKSSESLMEGIPRALPSLLRAEKVQRKAASVGFDWETISGVFEKIWEEQKELLEAHQENNQQKVFEEIGDLFFTLINFSRWAKIDPEEALTKAIEKFVSRFQRVENEIKKQNKEFKDFSPEQLEELWQKLKNK